MCNVDVFRRDDVVYGHDLHRIVSAVERIKPDAVFTVGHIIIIFEDIVFIQTLVGVEVRD